MEKSSTFYDFTLSLLMKQFFLYPFPFNEPSSLLRRQSLAGRGGSVSRRDHNQATGNRAQLAWAHKSVGTHKPIPIYSSGEGVWGRGASLREAASPPESPQRKSLREGVRGRVLLYREALSPAFANISLSLFS